MKTSANFFENWGGIGGIQHGFPLLFSACADSAERDLPRLAAVLARNVAQRFRIGARKGLLAEGYDDPVSRPPDGTFLVDHVPAHT